ncbi:uncharacterized protein METZ01_LOCUS291574 [marine metagenome]|uniref:Uncharacterized protein n=1 Tax=marine metagenome TaxID=408172 RepID=A0A382LQ25_9ZZZZ|tara:strand:+ start:259 stop:444 length:186 start_codon:yes stop_codon:yes gene_type:complete
MDWFTLEWLMQHLEWAVGLLLIGCIILFFFPILLGWQLKQYEKNDEIQKPKKIAQDEKIDF